MISSNELRVLAGDYIFEQEARRDGKGRVQVYPLPREDKGGTYEVAGINDKYHPRMAAHLANLVRQGAHDRAESESKEYMRTYTDPVSGWSNDPGIEMALRDACFNRGPGGAAWIFQNALGRPADTALKSVDEVDRAVAAEASQNPIEFHRRLRESRALYEDRFCGGKTEDRAKFMPGLRNRWARLEEAGLELSLAHASPDGRGPETPTRRIAQQWADRGEMRPGPRGGIERQMFGLGSERHKSAFRRVESLVAAGEVDRAERQAIWAINHATQKAGSWSSDPGVSMMVRDMALLDGEVRAARTLQATLGVKVDGSVGPNTRGALREQERDPERLIEGLHERRMKQAESLPEDQRAAVQETLARTARTAAELSARGRGAGGSETALRAEVIAPASGPEAWRIAQVERPVPSAARAMAQVGLTKGSAPTRERLNL